MVFSLHSRDTIAKLGSEIAAIENIDVDLDQVYVSCVADCKCHPGTWPISWMGEIADCYTVIAGKYYYPWSWHKPWFEKGFH